MRAERDTFWDVVKGLGIICVYLGHSVYRQSLLSDMIFAFHMPLFFCVSGLFFNPGHAKTFKEMMRGVFVGLLIPYMFFCVLHNLAMYDQVWPLWRDHFVRICYRTFVRCEGGPALWFFGCLAVVRVVAWTLCRNNWLENASSKTLILMSLAFAGCLFYDCPDRVLKILPLSLPCVPMGLCAFLSGYWLKNRINSVVGGLSNKMFAFFAVFGMLMFLAIICAFVPGCARLNIRHMTLIGIVPCIIGISLVFMVARLLFLLHVNSLSHILMFIGRFSMCFFAIEFPLEHVFVTVLNKFGVKASEYMYAVQCPFWLVALRMVVLLGVSALVASKLMAVVKIIQERVKSGFADNLAVG